MAPVLWGGIGHHRDMQFFLRFCLCLAAAVVIFLAGWHPQTDLQRVDSTLASSTYSGDITRVAVIGDLHFSTVGDFSRVDRLLEQLAEVDPQAIFLVGDFIGDASGMDRPRRTIVAAMNRLTAVAPVFAVLGNHDNGAWREGWFIEFKKSDMHLVEGTVVRAGGTCIRGLGDTDSGFWSPVSIPGDCQGITLTLTHDPQGLIEGAGVLETPGFAGHTHCGQIRFPYIGGPLVPTVSPRDMHCGAFERGEPGVTTGGIGASLLPFRWGPGAEPRWEWVRIN